jgi:hypothetical protein
MLRIAWVNCRGYKSNGDYFLTKKNAEIFVLSLNEQHTSLHHWAEEVGSPMANLAQSALSKLSMKNTLEKGAEALLVQTLRS